MKRMHTMLHLGLSLGNSTLNTTTIAMGICYLKSNSRIFLHTIWPSVFQCSLIVTYTVTLLQLVPQILEHQQVNLEAPTCKVLEMLGIHPEIYTYLSIKHIPRTQSGIQVRTAWEDRTRAYTNISSLSKILYFYYF